MIYSIKAVLRAKFSIEYTCLRTLSGNEARNLKRVLKTTINDNQKEKTYLKYAAGLSGLCLGFFLYKYKDHKRNVYAVELETAGRAIPTLPTYSISEVSKHSSKEAGIWVIYKDGVYDISEFVDKHPGGDKIMMAAGGSVEPFWMIYGVHKNPDVFSMLEKYRIGNLDSMEVEGKVENVLDPYSNDPIRHPALRPCSSKPYNAEPPPDLLVDSFITPQEIFYVRNHLPVPEVDLESYELEISGVGIKDKTFSMENLKNLPKHSITASIQCAGNRRSEMSKIKAVKGLEWGPAVIGNAVWSGVRLCDLLAALGVTGNVEGKHVQFEGLDYDPSGSYYGSSIPLYKALDKRGDVLLAYEMNGQPLSRDHGFPLRVVVPGVVGARNVKWLSKIIISEEESTSHWQQNDYKGFCPSVDWDTVDFSKAPAIQELPVISAICNPLPGQNVYLNDDGKLSVKGYAWSGGGRKVVRVDVTVDEGKTWTVAEFSDQGEAEHSRHWSWTLWQAEISAPPGSDSVEIWAKAVDSSYNTQPESFSNIWNLRGVLGNAYHRVKVNIKKRK
nr:sulfite oxidase isoform X2 [Halyomorpha halys]